MLVYLYDGGGTGDDSEDVEGSPGHKEDNWDRRQEDVGPPFSILLADGCNWQIRVVQVLLGLLEGKIDTGIGHSNYYAGDQELD